MLNNLFKSFSGILLLLLANIQPPTCVNQTLVAFWVGFPLEIWTWIGSLFSFDPKYILYPINFKDTRQI